MLLQLVGKRYPSKAFRTLTRKSGKKKKKKEEEEEMMTKRKRKKKKTYSLQRQHTWEHKALPGSNSILSRFSYFG